MPRPSHRARARLPAAALLAPALLALAGCGADGPPQAPATRAGIDISGTASIGMARR